MRRKNDWYKFARKNGFATERRGHNYFRSKDRGVSEHEAALKRRKGSLCKRQVRCCMQQRERECVCVCLAWKIDDVLMGQDESDAS